MWVHFNFLCNANTQIRLHRIFRREVARWKGSLIDGCVLTYHFSNPPRPADSLYVCLNILSMKPPASRSIDLSEAQRSKIPREILNRITELASQFLVNPSSNLQVRDYEFDLRNPNTLAMYRASSTEEILNFASKGTEIALEILEDDRTKNRTWTNDKEIAEHIMRSINEHLTTQNERNNGLHFVCNPLGLWNLESYLLSVISNTILPNGRALTLLYQIEAM
jgi:hypothetical protein